MPDPSIAPLCREELSKQIAGFQQEWFGRMHRIDKFFHRVRLPPGAKMDAHKGASPTIACLTRGSAL